MDVLTVAMYSVKPFDKILRGSFQLPGNPYVDEKAQRYIHELGVIHFRDTDHPRALIIQPKDDDKTEITDRRGFAAFRQLVVLHPKTFKVMSWDNPQPEVVEKNGDAFIWYKFNQEIMIISMDNSEVLLG